MILTCGQYNFIIGTVTAMEPHNGDMLFSMHTDAGREIIGIHPSKYDTMVGDKIAVVGEIVSTPSGKIVFKKIYELSIIEHNQDNQIRQIA